MGDKQQKPLSALLLTLFSVQMLLPLLLSLSVIFIKHQQRKLVKEHNAEKSFFTRIRLNDISGFDKNEEEFVYMGTWYDAARIITQDGETFVLAVPDKKETHIAELSDKHFERYSKKQSSSHTPFFTFLFFETPDVWHYAVTSPKKTYNYHTSSHAMAYLSLPSPPPWA